MLKMFHVVKRVDPSPILRGHYNHVSDVTTDFEIFRERFINHVTISCFEQHDERFLTLLLLATD
jgi:hypothetical protein